MRLGKRLRTTYTPYRVILRSSSVSSFSYTSTDPQSMLLMQQQQEAQAAFLAVPVKSRQDQLNSPMDLQLQQQQMMAELLRTRQEATNERLGKSSSEESYREETSDVGTGGEDGEAARSSGEDGEAARSSGEDGEAARSSGEDGEAEFPDILSMEA
ncbi:uncharacterized protein LOC135100739 [Scylla paramamosain]|uniref:uncharacterized protein LOC135100739 n=1 Tax=Scylla paramamosain TaxID=85552 RepID=UPI0030834DEF